MQVIKYNATTLKQNKVYPGLMEVELEHKISETKAQLLFTGPPIHPEMWHEVLEFFKWVNDTMHSECQVRLFLNTQKQVWDAWAFPQEARTGMTAKEIAGEEFDRQRAQYPENEGWVYFGTVHHHCSGGAFQSGVDEWNEKNQDGIHITVGKMDQLVHDIHCRFYLQGSMFEPPMEDFWDIGDEARRAVPAQFYDTVARYQMCKHPAKAEFPEKWKTNMIEIKTHSYYPSHNQGYLGVVGTGGALNEPGIMKAGERLLDLPLWRRKAIAARRLWKFYAKAGVNWGEFSAYVDSVRNNVLHAMLIKICGDCSVDIVDVWQETPVDEPAEYKQFFQESATDPDGIKIHPKKNKKGKASTAEVLGAQTNHGVQVPIKGATTDDPNTVWDQLGDYL